MRYAVTAQKGDDRRCAFAQGEAAALDVIDDFIAAGFTIEEVEDESDVIDAMALVERLYAADDPARAGRG